MRRKAHNYTRDPLIKATIVKDVAALALFCSCILFFMYRLPACLAALGVM